MYISGKISGLEEKEAFDLFEAAEKDLKEMGWNVINPMKLPHKHDKTWESYMREDLKALMDCDAIRMLPNWRDSKGAIIEFKLAIDLGITII